MPPESVWSSSNSSKSSSVGSAEKNSRRGFIRCQISRTLELLPLINWPYLTSKSPVLLLWPAPAQRRRTRREEEEEEARLCCLSGSPAARPSSPAPRRWRSVSSSSGSSITLTPRSIRRSAVLHHVCRDSYIHTWHSSCSITQLLRIKTVLREIPSKNRSAAEVSSLCDNSRCSYSASISPKYPGHAKIERKE